ncbi:MAG: non-canonical purine NTP pyrophosphatase [Planctomycetota bacterium]
MTDLWIASNNEKKRTELLRLLGPLGYELRPLRDAPGPVEMIEDAPDFAGNAAIKAVALARVVRGFAIGDDSGLCVDALGGEPGVRSARWAGEAADDGDRIAKLLGALEAIPEADRAAHFVCHVCVADPQGRVVVRVEETCAGSITREIRGEGGFGYDPVFVAAAHRGPDARTFAQLTAADKDAVSHRGKALRRLVEHLRDHPLG